MRDAEVRNPFAIRNGEMTLIEDLSLDERGNKYQVHIIAQAILLPRWEKKEPTILPTAKMPATKFLHIPQVYICWFSRY